MVVNSNGQCMNCGRHVSFIEERADLDQDPDDDCVIYNKINLCGECYNNMEDIYVTCSYCNGVHALSMFYAVSYSDGVHMQCHRCLITPNIRPCVRCGMRFYDMDIQSGDCWLCSDGGHENTNMFISKEPMFEFNLSEGNLQKLNDPSTEL